MPIADVLFKGTKSKKFQVDREVRQGCVLLPLLFVVVLDSVLKKTNTGAPGSIQWWPHQKLYDLNYADDICFLVHRLPELKDKLIENAKQRKLQKDETYASRNPEPECSFDDLQQLGRNY